MDVPMATPIPLDESGRLATDANCIKCGYNLRGLSPASACPECGTAIGRSLHGDLLRFRDPDWLGTLVSGMNWIVASIALHIVFSCVAVPLAGVVAPAIGAGRIIVAHPLTLVVRMALQLVGFVGYWKVTSPDPGGMESEQDLTARKVARIALVIRLALQPLQGILPMGHWIVTMLFSTASWIIGLVWLFAILINARRMALRIPDETLARHTRIVMWGMVIPVINVIFIIWSLILIGKYRTYLRTAAQQARETWAAPLPPAIAPGTSDDTL